MEGSITHSFTLNHLQTALMSSWRETGVDLISESYGRPLYKDTKYTLRDKSRDYSGGSHGYICNYGYVTEPWFQTWACKTKRKPVY